MERPSVFIVVRNFILLFISIGISILYYVPISAINTMEIIAQHIAATIIYFVFLLGISALFAIGEKLKELRSYKIRSTIGSVIGVIILIFLVRNSYLKYIEKEDTDILNLARSVQIDESGNINFETSIDFDSRHGKKILELFEGMYDDIIKTNTKMKEYENIMFSLDTFKTKENLEKAIKAHEDGIGYLKNFSTKGFSEVEKNIERLFEGSQEVINEIKDTLREDYENMLAKEDLINLKKLKLFETSLVIHKYYIDNYDNLEILPDGTPKLITDDDDYAKKYEEYERAYDEYTKVYMEQVE